MKKDRERSEVKYEIKKMQCVMKIFLIERNGVAEFGKKCIRDCWNGCQWEDCDASTMKSGDKVVAFEERASWDMESKFQSLVADGGGLWCF